MVHTQWRDDAVMITVERVSDQVFRMTLTAEVRISGDLGTSPGVSAPKAAEPAGAGAVRSGVRPVNPVQLLTVEETAELLQVGRDKVYYLLRTGQLRSIKIGKLRRISHAWITEFLNVRLSEDGSLSP
jgi:excisionase family DNA binding protein